jgi:hypothetical protein
MTTAETTARRLWRESARGEIRFGRCHVCDRTRDESQKYLLVARIGRRWLCLRCWDDGC